MPYLNLLLNQKKFTANCNSTSIEIFKRTMFTVRPISRTVNIGIIRHRNHLGVSGNATETPLVNNTDIKTVQRHMPGQGYDCMNTSANIRTGTGAMLPQHEVAHINIIDKETGLVVAIFSSCKKETKGFHFVADENIKKQYASQGKPKEQWMSPYKQPRQYDSEKHHINKEATDFANKHQENIDKVLLKNGVHRKVPIKRISKDAGELYHENGQPIFDNYGREIDYD